MQQWQLVLTAALPAISTTVAGILRQDKLPPWINEIISVLVLVATAFVNAALGGKITGNVYADFLIVMGYAGALMHMPLGLMIQGWIQSNIISFGKATGSSFSEVEQLAMLLLPQLAPGLAQELQRLGLVATPVVQVQSSSSTTNSASSLPTLAIAPSQQPQPTLNSPTSTASTLLSAPQVSQQFTAPVLPAMPK